MLKELFFSGAICLVLFLYSMGGIVLSYVTSFFAKTPAAGFSLNIVLNFFIGEPLYSLYAQLLLELLASS